MSDKKMTARPLDEEFDTMMEVERNPCGAWQAIQSLSEQLSASQDHAQKLWDLLEEIDAQIYLAEEIDEDFAEKVHKALWESHN